MASILTITDGSTPVSLLSSSGYNLKHRGLRTTEASAQTVYASSIFGEGRTPVLRSPDNISERYRVKLTGSSHDNLATQLNTLNTLKRKAQNFHLTNWQTTPVYLTAKTKNETNTRYSLVYDARIEFSDSLFDVVVDNANVVHELTVVIEREPYWRSHAPQTLPSAINLSAANTPTPEGDATKQFVANYRGSGVLTHLYAYDLSATAFSSNLVASTAFNYFEVSGSTPAVGDIMYFGFDVPCFEVVMNIGTAFAGSGVTTTEHYSQGGGAWNTGPQIDYEILVWPKTGEKTISFEGATDWATDTINGQTAYWIKVVISAITTWTTSPAQADQVVYAVTDTYFNIAADQIDGDVSAIARYQFWGQAKSPATVISSVVMGAKSRGLSYFTSRLNFVGNNPTGWAESAGTDTTLSVADERGPDGTVSQCTFATNQTMVERWRTTLTVPTATADWVGAWAGDYHVFLRAEQSGGTAGDISVKLTTQIQNTPIAGPIKYLSTVNSPNVVSLGRISLAAPISPELAYHSVVFILSAKSDNGSTPNLNMFDLVFIPIDEWAAVYSHPSTGSTALQDTYGLTIDGGVLSDTTYVCSISSTTEIRRNIIAWESKAKSPRLEPSKQMRMYCLFYDTVQSFNNLGGGFVCYPVERFDFMRGAD